MEKSISFSWVEEILRDLESRFSTLKEARENFVLKTTTEGFEVYSLVEEFRRVYGVPGHVAIELFNVQKTGTPHIHKYAEAGFMFFGEKHNIENPDGALLLGEYNPFGLCTLKSTPLVTGEIIRVKPRAVHGFEINNGTLWSFGVHSPLIHENNDLHIVKYVVEK